MSTNQPCLFNMLAMLNGEHDQIEYNGTYGTRLQNIMLNENETIKVYLGLKIKDNEYQ